jgi:hypothetical protein
MPAASWQRLLSCRRLAPTGFHPRPVPSAQIKTFHAFHSNVEVSTELAQSSVYFSYVPFGPAGSTLWAQLCLLTCLDDSELEDERHETS